MRNSSRHFYFNESNFVLKFRSACVLCCKIVRWRHNCQTFLSSHSGVSKTGCLMAVKDRIFFTDRWIYFQHRSLQSTVYKKIKHMHGRHIRRMVAIQVFFEAELKRSIIFQANQKYEHILNTQVCTEKPLTLNALKLLTLTLNSLQHLKKNTHTHKNNPTPLRCNSFLYCINKN
jgi:hypothetical protein